MSRKKRRNQRKPPVRNPRKQDRMRAAGNMSRKAQGAQGAHKQGSPNTQSDARKQLASEVVSLTPLAPIIVRSGRPFDSLSHPDDARFPPPSTLAGCLRTAWARAEGKPFTPELAQRRVCGPLLLLNNEVLVPKPANAIYKRDEAGQELCIRATPQPFPSGCNADMPDALLPVQAEKQAGKGVVGKPIKGPDWWQLDDVLNFNSSQEGAHDFCKKLKKTGWSPSIRDRRTHVAIDPRTGASKDGQLFQTEGIDFDIRSRSERDTDWKDGPRLLARFDTPLDSALVHLGGERRLALLAPESEVWPKPEAGWMQKIISHGGLSFTLLTPGIFAQGYRPGWLDEELIGSPPEAPEITLQLVAVAAGSWQPHSGWDLANQRPRPTRKLVPAGAVYWFRILAGADSAQLDALWLTHLSDDAQDRRDGFGLALPVPWKPVTHSH